MCRCALHAVKVRGLFGVGALLLLWVLRIKLGPSGLYDRHFYLSHLWPCVEYYPHFIGVERGRKLPGIT